MDAEEAVVLDRERLQDGLYVDWPSIFALEQLVVIKIMGYACNLGQSGEIRAERDIGSIYSDGVEERQIVRKMSEGEASSC
jgi:hypothetical protein